MHSGRLQDRVLIEQATLVENDIGEMEVVYSPQVSLWAQIEPISGREKMGANALQSEVTHRVWTRYWPNITSRHRIRLGDKGDRILSIQSVINRHEQDKMLEILAYEWDSQNDTKAT